MTDSTIIYTHTDEAPALATYSFLPVVEAYASVLHATCPGACPQVLMRCIRALIRRDETSGWWAHEA